MLKWRAPSNGIYVIRAENPLFTPTIGISNDCQSAAGLCETVGTTELDLNAGAERLLFFSAGSTLRRSQTVEIFIELK